MMKLRMRSSRRCLSHISASGPSRIAPAADGSVCAAFHSTKNSSLVGTFRSDEVADEIEQTVLVAHLGKRTVQNRAGGRRVCVCRLPFHKKLLPCGDRPVAQSLGIAAREHELYSGEKGLVENLLLIGNELANAVRHLDRAALQFDHGDGDAVQVEDEVRPALVPAAQGYFLG